MFVAHRDGTARHGHQLWTVLVLERFLRNAEQPQQSRAPVAEPLRDAA
jgi:hypothetical protein